MKVAFAPRNLNKISTSISRVGLHTSGLATYVEAFSHFVLESDALRRMPMAI
jgi:hypothetical protein